MNIYITCLEEQTGYWQADITTDGNHSLVYTWDGDEYFDYLPVAYDNTITWIAGNDAYSGYFWIGYDQQNMIKVDTSHCGIPEIIPNEAQPVHGIVPPPTFTASPVDITISFILIVTGITLLVMRWIERITR